MNNKEKAAPQNGTAQTKQGNTTTQPTRHATKLERVALHLLVNGTNGASALSGLAGLNDLNFRNSISGMRLHHGITIADEFFCHINSAGQPERMKRYWLADRVEASKVVELISAKRQQRGADPLSQTQIVRYLTAFPFTSSHLPAA